MATEFPSFDLSKLELPKLDTDKLVEAVRDAAYITVGLGVLAFQKAQELRRDVLSQWSDRSAGRKTPAEELKAKVEKYVSELDERLSALEARFDGAVEEFEAKLPEQAGAIVGQVHDFAKSARKQVRELINKAS